MNDLDVLRLHIPPLGFFDHFACPDQVVVVGNGPDFLLGAADLTPETTFCNLFVVQRSQQQGARDYLQRYYQDIHDARTQHYAEELGTAIMTWECPDNEETGSFDPTPSVGVASQRREWYTFAHE